MMSILPGDAVEHIHTGQRVGCVDKTDVYARNGVAIELAWVQWPPGSPKTDKSFGERSCHLQEVLRKVT